MRKLEQYSAKESKDDFEALSEKLSADLRNNIKLLGNHPIYSTEWCDMAATCGRIAKISDMESKLSADKNESATLWETEEQALRFLLEDGKLNLCLRTLVDYKVYQSDNFETGVLDSWEKGDEFEKGMGVLLRNAWSHIEAVQTTDLPCLIHHIAFVLKHALSDDGYMNAILGANDGSCSSADPFGDDFHQRQETLVFYYIYYLMRVMGEIDEDRMMPYFREARIFILAVEFLVKYGNAKSLLSCHLAKGCEALSLVIETEDFGTHPDAYYSLENGDGEMIMQFQATCLSKFQNDMDLRKKIRPATDFTSRIKRGMSRSSRK